MVTKGWAAIRWQAAASSVVVVIGSIGEWSAEWEPFAATRAFKTANGGTQAARSLMEGGPCAGSAHVVLTWFASALFALHESGCALPLQPIVPFSSAHPS